MVRDGAAEGQDPLRLLLDGLQAIERGEPAPELPDSWPGLYAEVAKAFNGVAGAQRAINGKHARRVRPDSWDGKAAVLLDALLAVKKGDGTANLPITWLGLSGKIAQAFNDVVELNVKTQTELARLSRVVGKEGKLKQRANLGDVSGFWRENVEAVNSLMEDLVHPSSEVARVIGAVAQGDLSKSMALEVEGRPLEGEFLRTAKTINTMVEQLGTFAVEVTRVAREVGSEGTLGARPRCRAWPAPGRT